MHKGRGGSKVMANWKSHGLLQEDGSIAGRSSDLFWKKSGIKILG